MPTLRHRVRRVRRLVATRHRTRRGRFADSRPRRRRAAGAVRGDGVAGRAVAGAGHRARRRPRPFAGRDRCRLRRGRPVVETPRRSSRCAARRRAIAGTGGMVSIARPVNGFTRSSNHGRRSISVAAHNGPSSTVVTGDAEALDELLARASGMTCRPRGFPSTTPPTPPKSKSCGRHCASSLRDSAANQRYRVHLRGHRRRAGHVDPRRRLLVRQSAATGVVRTGVRWSYEHGYRTFIESSPHPVLTAGVQESLEDYGDDHSAVGTLRRNDGGMRRFLLSAAEVHVRGKSSSWDSMFDDAGACRIELPTYAFERKRYWMDTRGGFVDASSLGITRRSIRCSVPL